MQKIMIIGKLGNDAEVKQVNDKYLLSFSVACSTKVKTEYKTTWYKIVSFSDTKPNLAEYLKKGTTVFVEGEPKINTYTNKDGVTESNFEIIFPKIQLISGSKKEEQQQAPAPVQQPTPPVIYAENIDAQTDDLPF